MADVSRESHQNDERDDIDFTFDDVGEEQGDGDDFDFELGDGAGSLQADQDMNSYAVGIDANVQGAPASYVHEQTAPAHQDGGTGVDEIDYEDDIQEPATAPSSTELHEPSGDQEGAAVRMEDSPDDDEIDYDKLDGEHIPSAANEHEVDAAGDTFHYESINQPSGGLENGRTDQPAQSQDGLPGLKGSELSTFGAVLKPEIKDMQGTSTVGGEMNNGSLGNDVADDLNVAGLGRVAGSYPAPLPDVMVTWADDVCPLLKTSEADDPASFYLEDAAVLNQPLSSFLASMRKPISQWVNKNDEIHIRIVELGLEFAETTTEALLGQVTFSQLVTLHDRLVKNDDPGASRGLNLILTTRSNCTFRLKELVEGAGGGKGLSMFQPQPLPNESSGASDNIEPESHETSPSDQEEYDEEVEDRTSPGDGDEDVEELDEQVSNEEEEEEDEDEVEEPEEEEEQQEEESDDAEEDQDDLIDYDEPFHVQGHAEAGAGQVIDNEMDLIDYSNEQNSTMGAPPGLTEQQDSAEPSEDLTDTPKRENDDITAAEFDEAVDDLLSYDDELDNTAMHTSSHGVDESNAGVFHGTGEPEYSGDLDFTAGEDLQEQDDLVDPMAYLEGQHEAEAYDETHPEYHQQDESGEQYGDEYLDLGGDAEHADDEQPETEDKVTSKPPDSVEALGASSHHTSSTTTVNGDEIDYEDYVPPLDFSPGAGGADPGSSNQLGENNLGESAGVDEIDWDDEDKINVPQIDSSASASITGKRSREADDAESTPDQGHDMKRHRPGDVPS